MILAIGVSLLVVVAVVLALAVRFSRRPARHAAPVELPAPQLLQAEPEPVQPEAAPEPVITWTAALTVTPLDEAGRLRLIDDLALLGAPWTIELLQRAYQEELSPLLRTRIEAAFTIALSE